MMVERIVVNLALMAAGCMDGLATTDWFRWPRVYDIKTGGIRGKALPFSMQLAGYAYATHIWDLGAGRYIPMPEVDKEKGLIIHVPAGEGKCDIYEVDLAPGWEAMQLAADVLRTRKVKDSDVMRPLSTWTTEPADDLLAARIDWVTARARALVDAGHQPTLKDIWGQACSDIASFANGGPKTHEEIDRVAGACNLTETVHSTGGWAPDPDPTRAEREHRRRQRNWCEHSIPTEEQCPTCLGLPRGWTPIHKGA